MRCDRTYGTIKADRTGLNKDLWGHQEGKRYLMRY
jgi:hypothetical protein